MDRLKDSELLQTTDGRVWAQQFNLIFAELHEGTTLDEGWLIGWFANAIETGRAAGQRKALESVRSEALEEKFWVVEAVNEDDTVLSPPAYWYGGFVGSAVAGHVGSDINTLCTRFQNAQTAEYVKCLLRNAKIQPDRGHHWKIFKHVILSPARVAEGELTIDWTKPIQFKNGEPCHVLSIHPEGSPNFPDRTHVIQRDGVEGMPAIWWYNEDGKGPEVYKGKYDIINTPAPESPAKEQPGEVHCINDPRCAEWCGGDECFVPAKQPEYDCMICGGIVHGPFIKPEVKLHMRHSGKRPSFPLIECPKCGYNPPPPERP